MTGYGEREDCPQAEELLDWASGKIGDDARERLVEHAAACAACREKIAAIKRHEVGLPDEAPPRHAAARAKSLARKTAAAGPGRARHAWLVLFITFLVLSLLVPKYYMQMLLVAAVAAVKWLMDTRQMHLFINMKREGGGEAERNGRSDRLWKDSQKQK